MKSPARCTLRLVLLTLGLALSHPGWAARLALVVGNADYADSPLTNPVNDATDLAAALQGAGFTVTLRTNLNADAMREAISEFGDALRRGGPDHTGLFYFSGHGVQTARGNYLLPVGRAFRRTKDVELFAVEARAVLNEMQQARNPLNILILDACRDSPLAGETKSAGSDGKGLAPMGAPSGALIAFAAAPGKTASDNRSERNGLYTKHLIEAINTPGLRLEDVFKRVGARVEEESAQKGGDQSPEEVSKLRSEAPFYFRPGHSMPAAGTSVTDLAQQSAHAGKTVKAFYEALHDGNGERAARLIVPEKRTGPFDAVAMGRFYSGLTEPIELQTMEPLSSTKFRVSYRYRATSTQCKGSADVTVISRSGNMLIQSIKALAGC